MKCPGKEPDSPESEQEDKASCLFLRACERMQFPRRQQAEKLRMKLQYLPLPAVVDRARRLGSCLS